MPTYPNGLDPNGAQVCSATYKCRNPGDVWDAPDGYFGINFDDGPTEVRLFLYFLVPWLKPTSSTHLNS